MSVRDYQVTLHMTDTKENQKGFHLDRPHVEAFMRDLQAIFQQAQSSLKIAEEKNCPVLPRTSVEILQITILFGLQKK